MIIPFVTIMKELIIRWDHMDLSWPRQYVYSAIIYSDDPAVNTRTHVRVDSIEVDNNSVYPAKLGANNGIAMHIVPVK